LLQVQCNINTRCPSDDSSHRALVVVHDQGTIHLSLIMTTAQGQHIPLILHRSACTLTPDSKAWLPRLPLDKQWEHFTPLAHNSNYCTDRNMWTRYRHQTVIKLTPCIYTVLYLHLYLHNLFLYQVISTAWWWPTGRPKHVVVNCYVSTSS